ncbi:hypothetical protein CEXT_354231 [Caerostris extrusa]|uniref:Uncharacterized protein n=1 Tax=Caerostris extrusa TaxID=172846 RepID=A0AAV4UR88_CAEEX|nr:hypothetical protein CEXT_354231 [Caerostris extrusa]
MIITRVEGSACATNGKYGTYGQNTSGTNGPVITRDRPPVVPMDRTAVVEMDLYYCGTYGQSVCGTTEYDTYGQSACGTSEWGTYLQRACGTVKTMPLTKCFAACTGITNDVCNTFFLGGSSNCPEKYYFNSSLLPLLL